MTALSIDDLNSYQAAAAKTTSASNRLARAALGYFGEREEYLEKRYQPGRERDEVLLELGDRAWYLADLCTELELELGRVVKLRVPTSISLIAEGPKKYLRGDDRVDYQALREYRMPGAITAAWRELEAHAVRHIGPAQSVEFLMREILALNVEKLADRAARGTIKGDGDRR